LTDSPYSSGTSSASSSSSNVSRLGGELQNLQVAIPETPSAPSTSRLPQPHHSAQNSPSNPIISRFPTTFTPAKASDLIPKSVPFPSCPGILVDWCPGCVWSTYPYHRHRHPNVKWKPIAFVRRGEQDYIRLRSHKCTGKSDSHNVPVEPCRSCDRVPRSREFRAFLAHAETDPLPHTPAEYLNAKQFQAALDRKAKELKRKNAKVRTICD
jgi:hypothetical protein